MIDLQYIKGFYPPYIASNANFQKHIVKEYVELLSLEWLSNSKYADKLVFIGGTNLRLVHGIDRFSEDLDFDCNNLTESDFIEMTNKLIVYLQQQGFQAQAKEKDSSKLKAFRRSVYFPELLFTLQLSGHREERFLLKIEAQDQGIAYNVELAHIQRSGFSFPIPVPSIGVLLSMKLTALIKRQKGRDFYDVMFLWTRTTPNYEFLKQSCNIENSEQLMQTLCQVVDNTNINLKQKDFDHLLFTPTKSTQISDFLRFLSTSSKP